MRCNYFIGETAEAGCSSKLSFQFTTVPHQSVNRTAYFSWTLGVTTIWILLSSWLTAGALLLSCVGQLNRTGNAIVLTLGISGSLYGHYRLSGKFWFLKGLRRRRFKRLFPLLYLICAAAALIGGAIHAPTNFDAFSYRIPRLLHWLSAEHWHWIGGTDPRMDFSATAFECLMLPGLSVFHTLRFAFLINVISFLLLPGLVFLVFSALGVKRSVAGTWMWVLPCASCFVMEAGSIGNDLFATVYVLAALLFALRAIESGKKFDLILSVLSAALMTGTKASNLPLLLPVSICLLVVFYQHPKLIITAALVSGVASMISFAPLAFANFRHTGDWAGAPDSLLKLDNPAIGLAGNALLLASASLAPAVFPPADKVNQWFNQKLVHPPLRWIKAGFADFRFTHPQLASEENSGLGLGVTATLLLALVGAGRHLRTQQLFTLGGAVFAGFWVALVVYMMKLGNCGAPRLIAPYYVGLIALPLLLIQSGKIFTRTWWRWSGFLFLIPIVPALMLNPARPLLPMTAIIDKLKANGINNGILTRMEVVYDVYANRSDAQRTVRELLPLGTASIGFAGTSDESEYSFWLPLGQRTVREVAPVARGRLPDTRGFDAIVTSDWGCNDRFGISPEQLAEIIGWKIVGTTLIRTYASADEGKWSVICPITPTGQR